MMTCPKLKSKAPGQSGFSLIELMISLVLGLFVIGVIITVFVQSKRNYNQDLQIANMQENGRYALQLLSREVAHAGFLGGMSAIDAVTTAESYSDTCAAWFDPLNNPFEIYYSSDAEDKTCFDDETLTSDTTVLVIKRTDGKPSASRLANKLYFHTSGQGGSIIKTTAAEAADAGFVDWEYFVEIFYIKDDDTDGDGVSIPGLFRKRLIVSDGITASCDGSPPPAAGTIFVIDDCLLVPGIRGFGVQYGIDSTDDGIANQYQVASTYSGDMSKIVSARVSVLAGSMKKDPNYTNNKQYSLYPSSVPTADVYGLTDSQYYSRVFTTTTQVRNNAYRIQIYNLSSN